MKVLLDTHAFLWWISDRPGLTRRAREVIGKGVNECFVSIASCWEIAIKVSLGKLHVGGRLDRFLPEQLAANAFIPLPIDLRHALRTATLPFYHRDPFDRLLVAQALTEELPVVTANEVFEAYGVKRIW
jgi:PIN domain nuclease of toxin-antitoxin system